jgi:hypothetical protein
VFNGPDRRNCSRLVSRFGLCAAIRLAVHHFLIKDGEPLLFHTGMRRMFPEVRDAVAKLIDPASLRWISWSHFEVDECGALSPCAIVPCAVWEDDELMVLRLRADFGDASEFTLTQSVAGTEVSRAMGQVAAMSRGEIIYAEPAARIRELPVVQVELLLTAREGGDERPVASYTLLHGGLLHR